LKGHIFSETLRAITGARSMFSTGKPQAFGIKVRKLSSHSNLALEICTPPQNIVRVGEILVRITENFLRLSVSVSSAREKLIELNKLSY